MKADVKALLRGPRNGVERLDAKNKRCPGHLRTRGEGERSFTPKRRPSLGLPPKERRSLSLRLQKPKGF